MNETIKSIIGRRSIRRYKPEQIKKSELDAILTAGTFAPTAMNRQSPLIVAVTDPDTVRLLSQMNAAVLGGDSDPFYGAPAVVVVFADSTIGPHVEDGALVMGNMMNAAYSLGVGSCWIHRAKEMFEGERGLELKRKWGVPDNFVGIGNCILGYPAPPTPEARPRKGGYIIRV